LSIEKALNEITGERIVVILNFDIIIPCEANVISYNDQIITLREFINEYKKATDSPDIYSRVPIDSLLNNLRKSASIKDSVVSDPLQSYLSELRNDSTRQIIIIAPAGNLPVYSAKPNDPALWQEVISVAANIGDNTAETTWETGEPNSSNPVYVTSNLGEVMVPGGWYGLMTDYTLDGNYEDVAGTSYAAPTLGVFAAAYLSQPNNSAQGFYDCIRFLFNEENFDPASGEVKLKLEATFKYWHLPDILSETNYFASCKPQ
jgi:hypothetical protein